jgi:hypothetical protein
MSMKRRTTTVAGFLLVALLCGCTRSRGRLALERNDTPPPVASASRPTPLPWEAFPVEQIGSTLSEAVSTLGKWDPVSDVGPGPDGNAEIQGYPFSDRDGYDYIVCVAQDRVVSVYRRGSVARAVHAIETSQPAHADGRGRRR